MGRIVVRLPVELVEKVGTDDAQFACIPRGRAAHGTCERKSEGQRGRKRERAQGAHDGCVAVWG